MNERTPIPGTSEAMQLVECLRGLGRPEEAEVAISLCARLIEADAAVQVHEQTRTRAADEAANGMINSAAVSHIRKMLERNHVPPATFIDDCVANAVFQRNKLLEALEQIRKMVETGLVDNQQILSTIHQGYMAAHLDPKDIFHVEEAKGDS